MPPQTPPSPSTAYLLPLGRHPPRLRRWRSRIDRRRVHADDHDVLRDICSLRVRRTHHDTAFAIGGSRSVTGLPPRPDRALVASMTSGRAARRTCVRFRPRRRLLAGGRRTASHINQSFARRWRARSPARPPCRSLRRRTAPTPNGAAFARRRSCSPCWCRCRSRSPDCAAWGIVPDAVVGYSVGEVRRTWPALDSTRRWRLGTARTRPPAFARNRRDGGCGACARPDALLRRYEGRVAPAAVNSPTSLVLSGDELAPTSRA